MQKKAMFLLAAVVVLIFHPGAKADTVRTCNGSVQDDPLSHQCHSSSMASASGALSDQVLQLQTEARLAAVRLNFPLAESALRRAITKLLESVGTTDAGLGNNLYLDLAMIVAAQGKLDEGAALLDRVGPQVEASGDRSGKARLTGYKGKIAELKGDREAARAFAEDAVEQWRVLAEPALQSVSVPGADAELAMALNAEARVMLRDRENASAGIKASEALMIFDKATGAPRWWRAEILATLGEVSLADGRIAAAETYLKSAIAQRRAIFGEGADTLRMRLALGRAFAMDGLFTAAIVTYREAFSILRSARLSNVKLSEDDLVPLVDAVYAYAERVDDKAARQGLFAEAHEAFQLADDTETGRIIAGSAERMRAGSPRLASLLRSLDDAELVSGRLASELASLEALPQMERKVAVEREAGLAMIEQQAKVADMTRTLASEFPDYRRLVERQPPTLDELRSRLHPNEALASFLIGKDEAYVEVIRREGIAIAPIGLTRDELSIAVDRLRVGLETRGGAVGEFSLSDAYQLYRKLLGGVEGSLDGVSRLVVVPSGALSKLPFSILVRSPAAALGLESAHWLVRDMAIVRAPSTASFVALRATRPLNRPDKPVLAVANPDFLSGSSTPAMPQGGGAQANPCGTGQSGLLREVGRLPPLPESADEARSILRQLGGSNDDLLLGQAASEAQLRSRQLADYRVLYFATHAVLPGELRCAREGGLVLSPVRDGPNTSGLLLGASSVGTLVLRAELVVLSACNTGTPELGTVGSLSALAAAFFQAGARGLLVTHWQVPSRATKAIMTDLFARLRSGTVVDGMTVDEALREAQLGLIADPQTASPVFWGAFELLGDGESKAIAGTSA